MAKRGYKLQEFVAHTANVNCLKIGKKTHRNFITGGDDEKVNLWSVGKPTATTSLSGHTSPIESVAFDSTEVLVAAGASSGVIKLWDLEETKVVRTLNGHRSYCTALEFHPFGEFFASGSMDTNLKIWDIRKKGCIHTYKGHRRAVNTIRFSPDGRWVVSGGLDNIVKIWDLTAGKLLHEFTSHEGHIRSMDFHPLECLLATGSSDKTVKFWDLETFELIGSSRPEATAVRSITFHPDGRTLFCGLDSSLKVYSWEPVICHDSLDMGWSTLGDLCIDDGKLLGCSYYQNFVAVWVADILHLKLQGNNSILADENTRVLPKLNLQQDTTERVGSPRRSTISLDDDTKDIKNIYVDSMTPVASRKSGPLPTVLNSQNPKEINNVPNHRQVTAAKFIGQADGNSFMPDDNSAKDSVKSGRESMVNEQDNTVVSLKPAHRRRPSTTKLDIVEGLSKTAESGSKCGSDTGTVANFQKRVLADAAAAKDSSEEKSPISTCVMKEVKKDSFPGDRSDDSKKELKAVKYVNGVAVVHGRTRSLVERFEKREKLNTDESQISDLPAPLSTSTNILPTRVNQTFDTVPCEIPETKTSPDRVKTPDNVIPSEDSKCKTPQMAVKTPDNVMPSEEPKCKTPQMAVKTPDVVASESKTLKMSLSAADLNDMMPENGPDVVSNAATEAKSPPRPQKRDLGPNIKKPEEANFPPVLVVQRPRTAPSSTLPEKVKVSPMKRSANSRRVMAERVRPSPMLVTKRSNASPRMIPERTKTSPVVVVSRHDTPNRVIPQKAKSSPLLDDIPQTTGRGLTSKKEEDDDSVVEILMQNHDVYITILRSRLTKLQVVRHFWEQNDTRGAINALRKLPDHAVQADVVNVLMERMESLTLDHFSSLLPVLLDLLDSSTERHINVSLELILKLVAVFGPVITSTISAPPTVGVDLHAEKRRECCTECHEQLQRIHKCLPTIIRRGGLPARCAQELNVMLQKS